MPQLLEFLDKEKADIVCLQEVYNASDSTLPERYRTIETIQDKIGYEYSDFAKAFTHDGEMGMLDNGNAIVSRLPISRRSKVYLVEQIKDSYKDIPENWPIEPRVLQHVRLDVGDTELNVFNFHGVWDLDGDNFSQARQDMRDKILEAAEGLKNVIITGDTNAKASNKALVDLEKNFPSVFGQELESTFNMRRKDNQGYASAAVDLMYVSPNIKVISKSAPDVDISDHLPIVVELEISGNAFPSF